MTTNRKMRFLACVPAIAGLLLCFGCKPRRYEVLTRIGQDGTFHREILQPLDGSLPPDALEEPEGDHPSSQPASPRIKPDWRKKWTSLKIVEAPSEAAPGPYVQAAGDFPKATEIPPSYCVSSTAANDRLSEDAIGYFDDDYGLFAIDDWEEDITDTVFLPEYVAAVDRTTALLLPVLRGAMEELYGKRYDLKSLESFLSGDAADALREYCLWYYQYHPKRFEDVTEEALARLQDVLDLVGLELPLDDDGYVDTEALSEVVDDRFIDLLQDKVRLKRSGRKLTDEEAASLWRQIKADCGLSPSDDENGLDGARIRPTSAGPESKPSPAEPPARLLKAMIRGFEERNGKDAHAQIERLRIDMGGMHGHSPFDVFFSGLAMQEAQTFRFILEVPGPIIETNGRQTADQVIRWTFTDADLFPEGMKMSARSIRWKPEVEKRLFGKRVLGSLADVSRLMDLIPPDGPVYEALQEAAEQGSVRPVRELENDKDLEVRRGAAAVLGLGKDE